MATIQFGATVTGVRGTLNGITFSANATSNYAKSWSRPPLSRSADLSLSRSRLTTAAGHWRDLDSAARTDWNAFAALPNEPDYDPWGFQRWITGFQWFTRATARRALCGLDFDPAVPTGAGLTAPPGFSLYVEKPGSGTAAASWTDSTFLLDECAILCLAVTPSPAAADVWRGWKLILALQNPGADGEDITSAFEAAFGLVPISWWVHGRLFRQAALGNRSAASVASCEITAP